MHIRLEDAIAAATINPAKQIGIYDKVGSIEEGKYADLVLMDKSLNIKAVYVHGKEIYSELQIVWGEVKTSPFWILLSDYI